MPRYAKCRRTYGRGKPRYHRRSYKRKRGRSSTYRKRVGRALNLNLAGPTLQIATRIQRNQKLKFVFNNTFNYDPQGQVSGPTPLGGKQEMFLIGFNCNSIAELYARNTLTGSANAPAVWTSQNPNWGVAPVGNDVAGIGLWQNRYKFFTVLGAKITIVAKTTYFHSGMTEPVTVFLHKTGADIPSTVFQQSNGAEAIADHPYVTKAQIMSSNVSTGAVLTQTYSPRKFEGVKDIMDNEDMRGSLSPFVHPTTNTNWILGICNSKGLANQKALTANPPTHMTSPLTLQVKLEYTVALQEPHTNQAHDPIPPGAPATV